MNDLDLLRTHGPEASSSTDVAVARTRAALLEEIRQDTTVVPITRPASRPRRRLVLGLAAASVAGAAVVVPSLLGLGGSGAVALGPVDPLTFPLTPAAMPPGLGAPVFELEPSMAMAQYHGAGNDQVSVVLPDSWDYVSAPSDAVSVDVRGQDAVSFTRNDAVVVAWRDDDGDVISVSGRGAFADADRVEDFAESLEERPQAVAPILTLAPEGWEVASYKADVTVTYADGDDALTATVLDTVPGDLDGYGARDVETVDLAGRPALLGRQDGEGWVLVGRTAAGAAFSLQAPETFTRDQVVQVAAGVEHR